jgi:hypothetical protein
MQQPYKHRLFTALTAFTINHQTKVILKKKKRKEKKNEQEI